MTQQRFAVEVLKTAISTIARYETITPPEGDVLLRLSKVADENGRPDLGAKFLAIYVEEFSKKLGGELIMVPKTESRIEHGYVVKKLEGQKQLLFMQRALLVLGAFDYSGDPKISKAADELLDSIGDFAQRCIPNPIVHKLTNAMTAAVAHGVPTQKAIGKTKKKGTKK
ncbi:hypothetical protein [Acidobacterium sp. S8]|uniref:hypothetical protein n=1 Tax=Acidobacterium sp. S8 TaxID=1641854 RepID=UPI00131D2083|nr:hypothetical protein [Acidobacterium sp. S8]